MVKHEEGINPVAVTIINPRKEICRAVYRSYNLMFSRPVRYPLSQTSSVQQTQSVSIAGAQDNRGKIFCMLMQRTQTL